MARLDIRPVYLALAVLATSSCSQELTYTRSQPAPSSLVGHWEPDQESRRFLTETGHYKLTKHFLDLQADGQFLLVNMPDWWGDLRPHGSFESGVGHWKVEKQDGWYWGVELVFEPKDPLENRDMAIAVEGQREPYRLHVRFGDPDSDLFIRFVRTPSPTSALQPTDSTVTPPAKQALRRAARAEEAGEGMSLQCRS